MSTIPRVQAGNTVLSANLKQFKLTVKIRPIDFSYALIGKD